MDQGWKQTKVVYFSAYVESILVLNKNPFYIIEKSIILHKSYDKVKQFYFYFSTLSIVDNCIKNLHLKTKKLNY